MLNHQTTGFWNPSDAVRPYEANGVLFRLSFWWGVGLNDYDIRCNRQFERKQNLWSWLGGIISVRIRKQYALPEQAQEVRHFSRSSFRCRSFRHSEQDWVNFDATL